MFINICNNCLRSTVKKFKYNNNGFALLTSNFSLNVNKSAFTNNYFLKYAFKNQSKIALADKSINCNFSATKNTEPLKNTMTGQGDQALSVNYEDILKAQNEKDTLIIDVREDAEIQETGKLPGSIHIPMGNVNNALNLSATEFEEIFKRKKPDRDTKIIVSCRSGKRSAMVQNELLRVGYERVQNYVGGWLDWESNQKS